MHSPLLKKEQEGNLIPNQLNEDQVFGANIAKFLQSPNSNSRLSAQ